MNRSRLLAASVFALGSATSVEAQGVFQQPQVLVGIESRGYFFRPGVGLRTVGQWTTPIVVFIPVGSDLALDIGTRWAHTRITTYGGVVNELSGLTDTEVRASYTLGQELAVLSVVASLPTGEGSVAANKLTILGSVASDFLPAPVPTYGTGATLTGGLAIARSIGAVNIGLGGSARWGQEYQPFSDEAISYEPGVETRLQVAADALLGSGRISLGGTYSTFSTDNFTGLGGAGFVQGFKPGSRFVGEFSYVLPVGSGNLSVYAWDLARSSASIDTAEVAGSKENVLNLGVKWTTPSSRAVLVTPGLEFRNWTRDGERAGSVLAAEVALDVRASDRVQIEALGRTDGGTIVNPAGDDVSLQGWTFSLLARVGI